mmetsp:Transcript_1707/g.7615  ORF Transcript_1707/g.7615 Transcript_1707/m.7615 type:complete len:215 (+) Transcript_1707:605-1249(+)
MRRVPRGDCDGDGVSPPFTLGVGHRRPARVHRDVRGGIRFEDVRWIGPFKGGDAPRGIIRGVPRRVDYLRIPAAIARRRRDVAAGEQRSGPRFARSSADTRLEHERCRGVPREEVPGRTARVQARAREGGDSSRRRRRGRGYPREAVARGVRVRRVEPPASRGDGESAEDEPERKAPPRVSARTSRGLRRTLSQTIRVWAKVRREGFGHFNRRR